MLKASNNNNKNNIKDNLKHYRKKINLVFNRTAILVGLKSYLYIFFVMFRDLLSKIFFGFIISYFKLKKPAGENYNSKIVDNKGGGKSKKHSKHTKKIKPIINRKKTLSIL